MSTVQQSASQPHPVAAGNTVGTWPPRLGRIALGAVLAAGIGWLILKSVYPIFTIPPEIAILPDPPPTPAVLALEKAQFAVDSQNFSIVFGLIGAVLGACCVAFSFGIKAWRPLLIAVIAAAALGVCGANLSSVLFTQLRSSGGGDRVLLGVTLDALMQAILGYASLWGLIGLGVGIGVGAERGLAKMVSAGIAGLVGGLFAAMLYVLLNAQLSPTATMSQVFPPEAGSQVVWFLVFCVSIAVAIALGSGEKAKKPVATATAK